MGSRYRRWPRTAIVLICVCALGNLRLSQRVMRNYHAPPEQGSPEQLITRFEPLRPLLPAGAVAGLLFDDHPSGTAPANRDARLYLAQYVLSPRLVERSAAHRWVIVDSDNRDASPAASSSANWTLIADLRNGVRLYQTQVQE